MLRGQLLRPTPQDIALLEQCGESAGDALASPFGGGDDHVGEARVHGKVGHGAAGGRHAVTDVDGAELDEEVVGVGQGTDGRAVEEQRDPSEPCPTAPARGRARPGRPTRSRAVRRDGAGCAPPRTTGGRPRPMRCARPGPPAGRLRPASSTRSATVSTHYAGRSAGCAPARCRRRPARRRP